MGWRIKEVKISALKSIENLTVSCSKLNIIAGANSSGKSVFIQALLLVKQNSMSWHGLNGKYVSLGDFRLDAKNYHVTTDKIEIEIRTYPESAMPFKITFKETEDNLNDRSLFDKWVQLQPSLPITNFDSAPFFSIQYLSCSRIGVQDLYPKNYASTNEIGTDGEYALFCLQANKNKQLNSALVADSSSETLLAQVNYWLHYIIGAEVFVEDIPGTDAVKASYDIGNDRATRPCNVGSGISYLISIIMMCLLSDEKDILIIENPEIHLHPKAQSHLCDFFYYVANAERQLFVETHSDHIFNGIRVGIATGTMKKDDITINYFYLNEKLCTENQPIEIGKKGRILNYIDGLFDQFDIDLDRMLKL